LEKIAFAGRLAGDHHRWFQVVSSQFGADATPFSLLAYL
jgi:hypothetical protein